MYSCRLILNNIHYDNYIFGIEPLKDVLGQSLVFPDNEDEGNTQQDVAKVCEHSGKVWQGGKGSEAAGVPEALIFLAMMQHHLKTSSSLLFLTQLWINFVHVFMYNVHMLLFLFLV